MSENEKKVLKTANRVIRLVVMRFIKRIINCFISILPSIFCFLLSVTLFYLSEDNGMYDITSSLPFIIIGVYILLRKIQRSSRKKIY